MTNGDRTPQSAVGFCELFPLCSRYFIDIIWQKRKLLLRDPGRHTCPTLSRALFWIGRIQMPGDDVTSAFKVAVKKAGTSEETPLPNLGLVLETIKW